MNKIIISLALILSSLATYAQTDTLSNKPITTKEYYDVVAVYREHIDGRGEEFNSQQS
jgi:hypothetical protein